MLLDYVTVKVNLQSGFSTERGLCNSKGRVDKTGHTG